MRLEPGWRPPGRQRPGVGGALKDSWIETAFSLGPISWCASVAKFTVGFPSAAAFDWREAFWRWHDGERCLSSTVSRLGWCVGAVRGRSATKDSEIECDDLGASMRMDPPGWSKKAYQAQSESIPAAALER